MLPPLPVKYLSTYFYPTKLEGLSAWSFGAQDKPVRLCDPCRGRSGCSPAVLSSSSHCCAGGSAPPAPSHSRLSALRFAHPYGACVASDDGRAPWSEARTTRLPAHVSVAPACPGSARSSSSAPPRSTPLYRYDGAEVIRMCESKNRSIRTQGFQGLAIRIY